MTPPDLRLMGDIDILIGSSDVALVMDKVAGLGYEITDDRWRLHRTFGRRRLPGRIPSCNRPNESRSIQACSAPRSFFHKSLCLGPTFSLLNLSRLITEELRVARFTPEFQFVFTLSKWSVDENWAINLTSVNDIIHILKKYESTFNWQTLSKWIAIAAHTCCRLSSR